MVLGSQPIGVLLAGGAGRRLGGDKARVALAGRPLAQWALDALREVLDDVVIACRLDTELPALRGVSEAWVESEGPRGAIHGIVSALREARGRPIVACSINLPLMSAAVVCSLAEAAGTRPAIVPEVGGALQPLIARWEPSALPVLSSLPADVTLVTAARALGPGILPFDGEDPAFTIVHAPEDLLRAAALLDTRRPPHLRVVA
jgi:molybdopterin-guanine dinucleotide biosynthesis protein A